MKKSISLFLAIMMAMLLVVGCSGGGEKSSDTTPKFSGTAQVRVFTAVGQEWIIDQKIMTTAPLVAFETTQGKSGEEPTTNEHSGILLKDILAAVGVDLSTVNQITCTSQDGFSKAYSKADLEDPEKLFLTFAMDGENLTYENQDCFFIVAKNENFKQNWTKFLKEIEIS
ncbi:hypothetical protein [Acetobacterium wieringae]|uniref:hypothetical protein n=1 Tax=Acetobacterium wieringae TaxID=52694 RepID=UPI0026EB365A|nr:hypothetical protein [Acetobacterium wieringae]